MKTYHKRRLPHIQPVGATFFVTWNLEGAIPREVLDRLKRERYEALWHIDHAPDLDELEKERRQFEAKWTFFKKYDNYLDNPAHESPYWLKNSEVAKIVADRLHEFNGRYYDLLAFCIMSNHVHALFDFSMQLPADGSEVNKNNYKQLWQVMKLIKGATGTLCNRLLDRMGEDFWQEEYFDRFIRNEVHLSNAVRYTVMNPVKAGICLLWQDYANTWVKPGLF